MPGQQEHGPSVQVKSSPELAVYVSQSYRSGDDFWRGMVTITFRGNDLMDIEGSVKDGKNGLWFAPPSRSYEDRNKNTKWKNLVWLHDRDLAGAMVEAVQAFVNPSDAPVDDDDIPL